MVALTEPLIAEDIDLSLEKAGEAGPPKLAEKWMRAGFKWAYAHFGKLAQQVGHDEFGSEVALMVIQAAWKFKPSAPKGRPMFPPLMEAHLYRRLSSYAAKSKRDRERFRPTDDLSLVLCYRGGTDSADSLDELADELALLHDHQRKRLWAAVMGDTADDETAAWSSGVTVEDIQTLRRHLYHRLEEWA